MELPRNDTPTANVLDLGYAEGTDRAAVRDCMQLLRVSKRLLGHFLTRFTNLGLSPGKYSVLMELLAIPPQASLLPSELARRVGVSRPTITGLVDGLVRDGRVVRETVDGDRRKVRVRITAEGREEMASILPGQFDAMAAVVADLSDRDRRTLSRVLEQIEEKLRGPC